MTEDQIAQIIRLLLQERGMNAAFYDSHFTCTRIAEDGTPQELTLTVRDAGPDEKPERRYRCFAEALGEVRTSEAYGGSIEEAISKVRWPELDALPRIPIKPPPGTTAHVFIMDNKRDPKPEPEYQI
jgi:hypothetical protein